MVLQMIVLIISYYISSLRIILILNYHYINDKASDDCNNYE